MRKTYLQLHLCVLLWGFTPILGRLISLETLSLVWWRMLVVALILLWLPKVRQGLRAMPWRLLATYVGIGVLLSISWMLFYGAIRLSNASVGAICLAAAPIFLVFIEPMATGNPFNPRELLLGLILLPGMALVMGGIPSDMYLGLLVGLGSALFLAIFSAWNKRVVERAQPMVATCIEMGAGAVFLTVLAPLIPHAGPAIQIPGWRDTWLLALLIIACTLVPFVLLMSILRQVSAFTTQMATNLEPLYAIFLAIPLLGEQQEVTPLFYLGVIVVVASVAVQPILVRKRIQPDA